MYKRREEIDGFLYFKRRVSLVKNPKYSLPHKCDLLGERALFTAEKIHGRPKPKGEDGAIWVPKTCLGDKKGLRRLFGISRGLALNLIISAKFAEERKTNVQQLESNSRAKE